MKKIILAAGIFTSLCSFSQTTFKNIIAERKDCNINLQWIMGAEPNIEKYTVEISTNGNYFTDAASVTMQPNTPYTVSVPIDMPTQIMFIRVKAVEKGGATYYYSKTVTAEAICNIVSPLQLSAKTTGGPNSGTITIISRKGSLTGRFSIKIIDEDNKLVHVDGIELKGSKSFMLFAGDLKSGKYLVSVASEDNQQSGLTTFEKE